MAATIQAEHSLSVGGRGPTIGHHSLCYGAHIAVAGLVPELDSRLGKPVSPVEARPVTVQAVSHVCLLPVDPDTVSQVERYSLVVQHDSAAARKAAQVDLPKVLCYSNQRLADSPCDGWAEQFLPGPLAPPHLVIEPEQRVRLTQSFGWFHHDAPGRCPPDRYVITDQPEYLVARVGL